ncbi:MAG: hypothetical protein QM758_21095 [Armatimonas sp.]
MNLLKRLFKQPLSATPPPYKTIEIVPNVLAIQVYSHAMETMLETFPCWTFISKGLSTIRQKEIIVSLKQKPDDKEEEIFDAVLNYYKIITRLVMDKRYVDQGGFTQFGERKFFEHHLIYVEPRSIPDVPVPRNALCVLMVNEEELEWFKKFGELRITAKLGAVTRHFPYPTWSDRDRKSVVSSQDYEASILSKTPILRQPEVAIFREKDEIVLELEKIHAAYIQNAFAEFTPDMPRVFLGKLPTGADACLAWDSSYDEPFAISAPDGQGKKLAACFFLLNATDEAAETIAPLEDGFAAVISYATLQNFNQALQTMKPFRLPGKFRLQWV